MRLSEHRDFSTIIVATAEHFAMPVQIAEKDYYVTEALRVVQRELGDRAIFKGGTSLSKGWRLIPRFSEDIDLFVDPEAFDPALTSKKRVDKTLRRLKDAVADHPDLTYVAGEGHTSGGLARKDYFGYASVFTGLPEIRPVVLLEPGIRSGRFPVESRSLQSCAAVYLESRGLSDAADDLAPFPMMLMHFRRTFVEKLFTLHSHVHAMLASGRDLGRSARHYADVHVLLSTPEVSQMLAGDEFAEIKRDCDATSRRFFGRAYFPPAELSFSQSPAFFPDAKLEPRLRAAYERDCRPLFYGPFPTFDAVLAGFEGIRGRL